MGDWAGIHSAAWQNAAPACAGFPPSLFHTPIPHTCPYSPIPKQITCTQALISGSAFRTLEMKAIRDLENRRWEVPTYGKVGFLKKGDQIHKNYIRGDNDLGISKTD